MTKHREAPKEFSTGVNPVTMPNYEVFITTVEPRLSEPHGRHTIGSDKREVRIDGVASEMTIGRV